MAETYSEFEKRKQDHIDLALRFENEAVGLSGLDKIILIHEALPDINWREISISRELNFGSESVSTKKTIPIKTPFLISSMTAGHAASPELNFTLAKAAAERGWLMGVGSQRRELTDSNAAKEWELVRKHAPEAQLLGNIGIAQLILTPIEKIQNLVDSLEAVALIVHVNALQEVLQPEGTPNFEGGFYAIVQLAEKLSVPVIVKETGCGFSKRTLQRLNETKIGAVDVSGLGGTHWGRIETQRAAPDSVNAKMRETFQNWGISTLDSLVNASEVKPNYQVWASGGIRSGLDAAKCLALGAEVVGFAKPILLAAQQGYDSLNFYMSQIEAELKTAMFCTGCKNLSELNDQSKRVWQWRAQI